jgi:REP element-mobilizing transposase RayT
VYHLITRGSNRRPTFVDDWDHERFLLMLAKVAREYGWSCLAFCLMPNHHHLLLSASGGISDGMQQLNGGYSRTFSKRYGGDAHLFRNRFRAYHVDRDEYLIAAARYIVLNPIRAGLCARPEQWRWSSYRASAGLDLAPAFLDVGALLGTLDDRLPVARRMYRELVNSALVAVSDTVANA